MCGIGKTELAIQYCFKHLEQKNYPGGICWLRAREENIGTQIIDFTQTRLNLNPPEYLETLEKKIAWCWTNWQLGKTLIVLDDITNYREIQPYLPPQKSQFKVLITTRLNLKIADSINLEVLQETKALELLSQLINSQQVQKQYQKARELCQLLGYLPLAIQLVGQYLKEYKISLTEELKTFKNQKLNDPALNISEENDPTSTSNTKRGVAAAFELSWNRLNKPTQELGCLLSLFALAPIPWSLVENTISQKPKKSIFLKLKFPQKISLFKQKFPIIKNKEELKKARIELERYNLLKNEKDNYQLHQLIQEFFQTKQSKLAIAEEQKYNLCSAIVAIAKDIPQNATLPQINDLIPLIPHLTKTANIYQKWLSDQDLLWLFIGISRLYESQGAYEQALPWREKYLSVTKERLGKEHPYVTDSLNNLAVLYFNQGRYGAAEPLYLEALEITKKLLGEEHPNVATSLNNLALLYENQGRYEAAEPLCLEALEIKKKLLGEEHPDVAISLNNLALLYNNQGRYKEAEPLYLKALELSKKTLGKEHPNVAMSLNNLAELYKKQERYKEAEPLLLQTLEMKKKLLGKEHPSIATSLNNLAELYNNQKKHKEAETICIEALKLRKKILGEEHPHTASSLNNLALIYNKQEKYSKAKSFYQQALKIFKKTLGETHPRTINCQEEYEILINSQN